jgi:hypothetical protein
MEFHALTLGITNVFQMQLPVVAILIRNGPVLLIMVPTRAIMVGKE